MKAWFCNRAAQFTISALVLQFVQKSHHRMCQARQRNSVLSHLRCVFCVFTSRWTLRWHPLINISNAATQSCFCHSLVGCYQGHFCQLWQYVQSLCWASSQYAVYIAAACESVRVWTLGLGLCVFFNFPTWSTCVHKTVLHSNKTTWTWLPELTQHKEKQNRQKQ